MTHHRHCVAARHLFQLSIFAAGIAPAENFYDLGDRRHYRRNCSCDSRWVTLWYLAIQLKQNTDLERVKLEVQLGVTWAEMHDSMIQNPNLARAYDLAAERWDEMSDEDVRAYLWFVAKSFHVLEGMFRQRQRGLLTGEVWAPYERYIFGVLQIEAVLGWWQSDGSLTSKEFQTYVDNLLSNTSEVSWRQISTSEMVPDRD